MQSRRDFIRISALGIGGITLGSRTIPGLFGKSLFDNPVVSEMKRYPTYCEVCFWKCAAWSHVDAEGRIQKIIGHDDDPHCNGRLCPRGTGGLGMYEDPDRLMTPLIRVEEDGKQTFRKASWDEALDLVAKRLQELSATYGPESIALFNHGSAGHHFSHLLKAMGSVNASAPSYAQCRGPREVGFKLTFGQVMGSPEPLDIRDTKCLVLIGSHLGENMHNGQVQEMADMIDKGGDIITVDPRYSIAAGKSKYWLPIKPATDIALLLAWINVLIEEKLYDVDFVQKNTIGFDQLAHHVRQMTPEWAYGITTIKPDLIRKTARLMAAASPAAIIHPGRHVTWYGDDTQRSRAIAILNALLGNWGRRGGFYFPEKVKVPDFPHPPYPKPKWGWREILDGKYPFAALSIANTFLDATIDEESPYAIHGWIVAGTNLPYTIPDVGRFEEAAQKAKFIVVVDTMPMEITGYADVILPECTYLERYDELRTSPHREPYIALRMPAAEPLGETKPAWWMTKELGKRLGLEDYFQYADFTEVLEWQLEQLGSSLDEMKKLGIKKFPRKSGPLYQPDNEVPWFNTPSGKVELYSAQLKEAGFDPIPNYTAHPTPPEGFYRLNYGRAPMHTFSRTSNNPYLADLMDENFVWVHPKVASKWSLENGQEVWLKNQDGIVSDLPIKVRITERIRWDSVYMVHGFGHVTKKLTQAYGKGVSDTQMITNVMDDPIMGGTGMRGNFVTFIKEQIS